MASGCPLGGLWAASVRETSLSKTVESVALRAAAYHRNGTGLANASKTRESLVRSIRSGCAPHGIEARCFHTLGSGGPINHGNSCRPNDVLQCHFVVACCLDIQALTRFVKGAHVRSRQDLLPTTGLDLGALEGVAPECTADGQQARCTLPGRRVCTSQASVYLTGCGTVRLPHHHLVKLLFRHVFPHRTMCTGNDNTNRMPGT